MVVGASLFRGVDYLYVFSGYDHDRKSTLQTVEGSNASSVVTLRPLSYQDHYHCYRLLVRVATGTSGQYAGYSWSMLFLSSSRLFSH